MPHRVVASPEAILLAAQANREECTLDMDLVEPLLELSDKVILEMTTPSKTELPKMRILQPTKIHECTDNESVRYGLSNVQFRPAKADSKTSPCLVASDGRILAIVPTLAEYNGEQPDEPILIPGEVFDRRKTYVENADIESGDMRQPKQAFVRSLGGEWTGSSGKLREGCKDRFPKIHDIAKQIDSSDCTVLALDANLLRKLADSISGEEKTIKLIIPQTELGKSVQSAVSVVGERGIGVLMPMTCEPDEACGKFNGVRQILLDCEGQ